MFASNQILEISGNLSEHRELETAFEFALSYSGHDKDTLQEEIDSGGKLLYQFSEDDSYCIGWCEDDVPYGWDEFDISSYDDIEIVIEAIRKYLEVTPVKRTSGIGSYTKGFVMKAICESMGNEYEKIIAPVYGLVYFRPYTCFYSK